MQCDRAGCTNGASWQVSFILYQSASLDPGRRFPLRGLTNLKMCQAHKDRFAIDELLDDENWDKTVRSFRMRGLAPPDRTRTEIRWEPLQ